MASDPSAELSKLLLRRMRKIREAHRFAQIDLAACMHLPLQAIKHIESGYQRLPGLQGGSGPSLQQWFVDWFACVEADESEQNEIKDLLVLLLLGN